MAPILGLRGALAALLLLLLPAVASGQQEPGRFAAIASTATRVEHILSLIEPFYDPCSFESEFDVRRCRERLPREQAAILSGSYIIDVPGGRDMRSYGISVSPYDFQRRRFELTVYGISSTETCPSGEINEGYRGPDAPPERPRRADCTFGGVATSPRRDGSSSPFLLFYVDIGDVDRAERWRNENAGYDDLVMSVVFRVGSERWREQILEGRGALMMMHPTALQVRNARSNEVIFETMFDSTPSLVVAPTQPPRTPGSPETPVTAQAVPVWSPPLDQSRLGQLGAAQADVEAALTAAGARCHPSPTPSVVPADTEILECGNVNRNFLAPIGQTDCIVFFRGNRLVSVLIPLGSDPTIEAAMVQYRRDLTFWPGRFGVPGAEPSGTQTPLVARFNVSPEAMIRIGMNDNRARGAGFLRLLTIESADFVNAQSGPSREAAPPPRRRRRR